LAYEDFVKLWNEEEEPKAPPPTSLGEQARLGVLRDTPMGLAGLVDLLSSTARSVPDAALGPARALGMGARMIPEGAATRGAGAIVPNDVAPQTPGQSLARAGAGGLGMALPTAFLGGGGALPTAARGGLELLSGIGGGVAGQEAKNRGASPLMQFIANMAGGFAPGAVAGGARRVGGNVAQRMSDTAQDAAAQRLAGKEYLKAAPRFADRKAAIDKLGSDLQASFPGGVPDDAVAGAERMKVALAKDVDDAYARAGNIKGIPTTRLKSTYAGIAAEAGRELATSVPSRIGKLIGHYGDETDLNSLRRLRRRIGKEMDRAEGVSKDTEQFRYLTQIKASIDDTIADVAKSGGYAAQNVNALDNALELARKQGRLFGHSTGGETNYVSQALRNYSGDPTRAVRAAVFNRNPRKSMATLTDMLEGDEAAKRGVGAVLVDEVLGKNFDEVLENGFAGEGRHVVNAGINRLRNRRDPRLREAIDEWYGPGSAKNLETMLGKMRSEVERGKIRGRTTISDPVNSDSMRFFSGRPIEAARRALKLAGNTDATRTDAETYFRIAIYDEEFRKALTDPIAKHEKTRWAEHVNRVMARPARAGVAATREDER
jgi:hypothetical protein